MQQWNTSGSNDVYWQKNTKLIVSEPGAKIPYLLTEFFKNTVHLAVNLNIAAVNEEEARKAKLGRGFRHQQEDRYVFKLAFDPTAELSEEQQRLAIAAHQVEMELQQRLFAASVAVPEVISVVSANSLLSGDRVEQNHPPLFIMAYVNGEPLTVLPAQDSLHQRAEYIQELWPKFIELVGKLEDQKVIHRDLKPDNIFLTEKGLILLDFEKAASTDTTAFSCVAGPFAAPEVRRGEASASADYYSLVALSFYLLTHEKPDLENRDRLTRDKLFEPMWQFWLRGFAEVSSERFQNLVELSSAFTQALNAFIRALKPREEAEDLRKRLQQHVAVISAELNQVEHAVKAIGDVIHRLRDTPASQWPDLDSMLSAIEFDYAAMLGAQQQLALKLSGYQEVLQQPLEDDDTAKNWLQARQQDPDLSQPLAALQKQLTDLEAVERLVDFEHLLSMPPLHRVEAQLTRCNELFECLKHTVDEAKQNAAQHTMLAAFDALLAVKKRDYNALQTKMSQADIPLHTLADLLRLRDTRNQYWQESQTLTAELVNLTQQLEQASLTDPNVTEIYRQQAKLELVEAAEQVKQYELQLEKLENHLSQEVRWSDALLATLKHEPDWQQATTLLTRHQQEQIKPELEQYKISRRYLNAAQQRLDAAQVAMDKDDFVKVQQHLKELELPAICILQSKLPLTELRQQTQWQPRPLSTDHAKQLREQLLGLQANWPTEISNPELSQNLNARLNAEIAGLDELLATFGHKCQLIQQQEQTLLAPVSSGRELNERLQSQLRLRQELTDQQAQVQLALKKIDIHSWSKLIAGLSKRPVSPNATEPAKSSRFEFLLNMFAVSAFVIGGWWCLPYVQGELRAKMPVNLDSTGNRVLTGKNPMEWLLLQPKIVSTDANLTQGSYSFIEFSSSVRWPLEHYELNIGQSGCDDFHVIGKRLRFTCNLAQTGTQNYQLRGLEFYHEGTVEIRSKAGSSTAVATPEILRASAEDYLGPMVIVPEGSFQMGCSAGDSECEPDEKPSGKAIHITSFKLMRTEVTVGQFKRFVAATGYQTDAEKNAGDKKGCYSYDSSKKEWGYITGVTWRNVSYQGLTQNDQHPVTCVSQNDAKAFVAWVKKETGEAVRLPSEAEWEYAARAGSQTKYHFGNDSAQLCQYGNVLDSTVLPDGSSWSDKVSCSDNAVFTREVGRYQPNGYGLYDMHGNVWEWTADCYQSDLAKLPLNGTAFGNGNCKSAVLRGGSWASKPGYLRVSYRYFLTPAVWFNYVGIRVAQDL
jgi:formylglycine-generating enzyme required for sulfatase activity/serine/threonine protein kinase